MAADSPGRSGKSDAAFRTIGELSAELGVPQHVLRYWEQRFSQLRPLQRAGNRRYYRPDDVALARLIHRLLNTEGYTMRGVQQVLAKRGGAAAAPASAPTPPAAMTTPRAPDLRNLQRVRDMLAVALADT